MNINAIITLTSIFVAGIMILVLWMLYIEMGKFRKSGINDDNFDNFNEYIAASDNDDNPNLNVNEVIIKSAEYIAENIGILNQSVLRLQQELTQNFENITINSVNSDKTALNIVLQQFQESIMQTFGQLSVSSSSGAFAQVSVNTQNIEGNVSNLVSIAENQSNLLNSISANISSLAGNIHENIQSPDKHVQSEAMTLQQEIRQSATEINMNWDELKAILREFQDNIMSTLTNLPATAAAGQLPDESIKKFEDSIAEFIQAAQNSTNQFNAAAHAQEQLLTDVVSSVQSVLNSGTRDIRSGFAQTHQTLQSIISDTMNLINADYQNNMRQMFQTMADNLASIRELLKVA